MFPPTNKRRPIDFPCPICGAARGQKCQTLQKRERKAHQERRDVSRSFNQWGTGGGGSSPRERSTA